MSGGGFAGTAFSTYVPHTVRKTETRTCTECHVSKANDNNAWLASLVMQGTGLMNFIGRYAYVGEEGHGFEAVVVTERDEPQAVIGSRLHELAYPDCYAAHQAAGGKLKEAYHHGGDVVSLQLRGEYLFAAQGHDGLRIYDVAQIDQKGFSQRVVSAPVSKLGQQLYIRTRNATSVALPSTMTIDPGRREGSPPELVAANQEQPVHPLYDYAFVTDAEEGLVVVGPLRTLLDGDPRNNFVKRAATFNPEGALNGARAMTFGGTIGYVLPPRGLVVLDLEKPTEPRLLGRVESGLKAPVVAAVQLVLSRGLDRDRAVDETGNQLAVFGRRGARPFNREELQRLLAVAPQADPKR